MRIAERWVSWADVGASYAGVVAALRAAELSPSPDQRDVNFRPKWDGREYCGGQADAGAIGGGE